MNSDNIFDHIPDDLTQEAFQTLVETSRLKIERIVSKGHASPESGWYDQQQNEWVMVLRGEASIAFEHEEPVHLRAGSYLEIAAHKKHKVIKTHPDTETIWLAVHF